MPELPPWIVTFLSAELFFLLIRSSDIKTLAKRPAARTDNEIYRATHGLRTALLLECLLFVPASALLLLLIAPLILSPVLSPARLNAVHAALGIASYGFPFGAVRALVTRAALNTLKEFASITRPPGEEKDV